MSEMCRNGQRSCARCNKTHRPGSLFNSCETRFREFQAGTGDKVGYSYSKATPSGSACIKDRQCPRVRPTLIILQQDRQLKRLDPYGLGAPFEFEPDGGNGYSGGMAIVAMGLKAPLPNLSGLIRDHAAFFVDNPGLPLRQMMFAAT